MLPNPGQLKTVSMMTAPPTSSGRDRPMIVMIGMRALRNAWRVTTIRGGRPLATAVVTYREPSTSSIDERV